MKADVLLQALDCVKGSRRCQVFAALQGCQTADIILAVWAARLGFEQRPAVQIRREQGVFLCWSRFIQHDRHGVGFGSNGAAGTPKFQPAGLRVLLRVLDQVGQNVLAHGVPAVCVAKKFCNIDG